MSSRLQELSALGQSVWIDFLSRDLVESGGLARAIADHAVTGVTSNPTIFAKALSGGHAYDAQIERSRAADPKDLFIELAASDIAAACDVLEPTWQRTGGCDGYVSIEVDPNLAGDFRATLDEVIRLRAAVDRPNLLVKVPATDAGVEAVEQATARGYSINVTLIFSLARHRQVQAAYIRGLERLVRAGGDPSGVRSVASFFVSRVDAEADRRLAELGRSDLRGRLAIANAKLAYRQFREEFAGERWEALAARGATPQRCLWASTATKDRAYRDTLYVEELIGAGTISTMPEGTLQAFADHGDAAPRLDSGIDHAHRAFEEIADAGVDYDDVVAKLEREGIDKFVESFAEVLELLRAKRQPSAAAAA